MKDAEGRHVGSMSFEVPETFGDPLPEVAPGSWEGGPEDVEEDA